MPSSSPSARAWSAPPLRSCSRSISCKATRCASIERRIAAVRSRSTRSGSGSRVLHVRTFQVATSPWQRCMETAEPLAEALGLEVQPDDRLGYDRADLAGFVSAAAAAHPGRSVVAVSHGDLIPLYLGAAGLLDGYPQFRTGSLFRLDLRDGRPQRATLIDRRDLKG